jgi:hypothetical protein
MDQSNPSTPQSQENTTADTGEGERGDLPTNSVDTQKLREATDQLLEVQREYTSSIFQLFEKMFKAHENGAAFYEKLIVFNVGTIALSLTLLGQLVAHFPGGHAPRSPFLHFLCPAWILLLLSIYCCARRITGFHNTNILLMRQMSALIEENRVRHVDVILQRVTGFLKNVKLSLEQTQQLYGATQQTQETLSAVFLKLRETMNKEWKGQADKLNAVIKEALQSKVTSRAARIATLATTFALLLICIFAIQTILKI